MHNIVVIGGGGHAKVIISILKKLKSYKIVGYSDIRDNGLILNIPYLGDDKNVINLKNKYIPFSAVLGIGSISIENALKRKKILDELSSEGIDFPFICSPDAIINEEVKIGPATVVMDGAVINSGSEIGTAVIVNTNSSIDHDCRIADFVHIAPGVTLSGNVTVGENSLLGTGSSVIHTINIPGNTIIGAGSVVRKNIEESGTYFGVPLRRAR